MTYDHEQRKQAWRELRKVFLIVALVSLLIYLLGIRWAVLGMIVYGLLIA